MIAACASQSEIHSYSKYLPGVCPTRMCLLHLYNLSNIKNHDYIPLLSWLTIIIYNMSTNYVKKNSTPIKSWVINSAQSWNRTSDTRIFSPLLYQLSYLGILHNSSGDRIWTYDLRVMSPTSFQTAPPRDINKKEMGGGGFEPPKHYAADLQSVPFGHSGIHPFFCFSAKSRWSDSNR